MRSEPFVTLMIEVGLTIIVSMPKKRPLLIDAYEEWLKLQPVTPASRVEKKKVEADTYEEWLIERIGKKHSKRI